MSFRRFPALILACGALALPLDALARVDMELITGMLGGTDAAARGAAVVAPILERLNLVVRVPQIDVDQQELVGVSFLQPREANSANQLERGLVNLLCLAGQLGGHLKSSLAPEASEKLVFHVGSALRYLSATLSKSKPLALPAPNRMSAVLHRPTFLQLLDGRMAGPQMIVRPRRRTATPLAGSQSVVALAHRSLPPTDHSSRAAWCRRPPPAP